MTDEAKAKGGGDSAATALVNLANERYGFHVTDSGEPFAVPKGNEVPKVVRMLRGGRASLRGQLARDYFLRYGKTPAQQALADALLVIEGQAQDGEPARLDLRVASHGGAQWVDLGDPKGRAIRVDGRGWSVKDSAPVMFRRTTVNAALPEPKPGGDLGELWSWLNVCKEDQPLVAAYLVAALFPDIPHPALILSGEQGSGKSTAQRVLVSILDPTPVPSRKPPRDADSWVTAASGSWFVGVDNLSAIPDWLSDSLCRAVTGDGDIRRQLYTDGQLVVFSFRRCIVLTGIDLGAIKGDLADRVLGIHLDVIPDTSRREEAEMWPGWADAHPLILGAVLDLAVAVAALLPTTHLASKPRMADFARILACVDKVLGTDGFNRYRTMQNALAVESLSGDAFITALAEMFSGTESGKLTSADVLVKVTNHQVTKTPADEHWRAPKGWPTDARAVTRKLREQAPVMRKAGWNVTDHGAANKAGVAEWTLCPPETVRNPSPPSLPSPPAGDSAGMAGMAGNEYAPSQDGLDL